MTEKEFCLSERRNIHEHLEKELARALRVDCTAQRSLAKAEMEMDGKSWEGKLSDIAENDIKQQLLSHKDGSCIRRISGPIKLKWKTAEFF